MSAPARPWELEREVCCLRLLICNYVHGNNTHTLLVKLYDHI